MVDFTKGQVVTFASTTRGCRAGGYGSARDFPAQDTARVTAVRKNRITVSYGGVSYNVERDTLATPNGEAWTETAKRKLGEVPEGMISPDDPRLSWLWEDAARVASNSGYCGYYDSIADRLNIPGRVREITIHLKHNGLQISSTVKARSRKEAEALIREKLGVSA